MRVIRSDETVDEGITDDTKQKEDSSDEEEDDDSDDEEIMQERPLTRNDNNSQNQQQRQTTRERRAQRLHSKSNERSMSGKVVKVFGISLMMGAIGFFIGKNQNGIGSQEDEMLPKKYQPNTSNNETKTNQLQNHVTANDQLKHPTIKSKNDDEKEKLVTNDDEKSFILPVQYDCPSLEHPTVSAANHDFNQVDWYDSPSKALLHNLSISTVAEEDVDRYLQDILFRQPEFDNWGHSYEEVKKGMSHWKSSEKWLEALAGKSNATIYESASGIGLNLYMTLELLQEQTKLFHGSSSSNNGFNPDPPEIFIYGNEYVPESVRISQMVLGGGSPATASTTKQRKRKPLPGNAKVGQLCVGDSSNLSFVPSDSFDLVYTGYISPLIDPLGLKCASNRECYAQYVNLCEAPQQNLSSEITEESASSTYERNRLAQHIQNEWYTSWTREMVRIAKPGAPIMIEQVSYPLCDAYFDWGGVGRAFWKSLPANNSNTWRDWIDPDSIEFEHDTLFRKRYHVYMRKRKELRRR